MTFPVIFDVFGVPLHAHLVFEVLGYTLGFQAYLFLRRRRRDHAVAVEPLLWIFVGCVMGALLGSKLLAWLESWPEYWARRDDVIVWFGGKTIVGGLIGGWVGVEIAKKVLGVRSRTGDTYVIPLCLGIAIGRVGCFLSGLDDHTHGVPTNAPWAVDFGDGIPRHPTQLYEIACLLTMAIIFWFLPSRGTLGGGSRRQEASVQSQQPDAVAPSQPPPVGEELYVAPGTQFRLFMAGYMLFRFGAEFIKPTWKGYAGLSAIQWAAVLTAMIAVLQLIGSRRSRIKAGSATSHA